MSFISFIFDVVVSFLFDYIVVGLMGFVLIGAVVDRSDRVIRFFGNVLI